METLKTPPYRAAHTYLAHLYEYPPPPLLLLGILTQWVMIPARIFTKIHESHLSGTISYIFKGINVFPGENEDNAYMHLFFFLFLVGGGCNQGLLWETCKCELLTLTECNFIESCIRQYGKWNIVHPLRVKRSTKTDFWSNRSKFIFHFFMILLPHWYRLGFWISCVDSRFQALSRYSI